MNDPTTAVATTEATTDVPGAQRPVRRCRWDRLVAGVFLIAAFVSLDRTTNSLRVTFHPPWDRSTPGELYFWLASLTFLLPGAALVGAAFEDQLLRLARELGERLRAATRDERVALAVLVGFLGFIGSYIGNDGFLEGMPLTDDEGAASFGGSILATGHLTTGLPPLREAFQDLFLFQRHGRWTSMDFLGAQLPWAFGRLTHTGTLVFRFAAACAPVGVFLAVRRRDGLGAGLVGAALVLVSPMAGLLGMTNHTHVISRCGIALGFGALLFRQAPVFRVGAFGGLGLGLAFLTRPAETVALSSPFLVAMMLDARRRPDVRRAFTGLVVAGLPLVVVMLAYNHGVTGGFGFARSAPNEVVHPYGDTMHGAFAFSEWGTRFGTNLSYNLLTLTVFFLGPLGVLATSVGARVDRTNRLLLLGVALQFALALLHDDRGLHLVGPIHYSETVVPLAIVSASGLRAIRDRLASYGIPTQTLGASVVGYLALGLPLFTLWHASALAGQTSILHRILDESSAVASTPAVVLTPPLALVRRATPEAAQIGSFVFAWPRPSARLDEPVIFLADSPASRLGVERAFPRRTAYVLETRGIRFVPVPLADARPFPDAEGPPPGPGTPTSTQQRSTPP